MNQEFRLKQIDETRNHLTEEINWNQLMSKKHDKVCKVLNYIEHSLIAISRITGCVSISALASLIWYEMTQYNTLNLSLNTRLLQFLELLYVFRFLLWLL